MKGSASASGWRHKASHFLRQVASVRPRHLHSDLHFQITSCAGPLSCALSWRSHLGFQGTVNAISCRRTQGQQPKRTLGLEAWSLSQADPTSAGHCLLLSLGP